jgi:hypothetical protein
MIGRRPLRSPAKMLEECVFGPFGNARPLLFQMNTPSFPGGRTRARNR